MENSSLKKKKSYWNTKYRKLAGTQNVALSTKIKDLYDQMKCLRN